MKKVLGLVLVALLVLGLAAPVSAWGSGGVDHTHQYVTARGIELLAVDRPTAYAKLTAADKAALLSYSDWPDTYENDGGLYTSHFYNPYTGKTFLGSTTALTRFTTHANNAKRYYAKNRTLAMQELGKALHFLADVNEPHHAALLIAGLSTHTSFESYADSIDASFVAPTSTLYTAVPTDAKRYFTNYCTGLFKLAAYNGYAWKDKANSSSEADWYFAAQNTVLYSQETIAAFLYNFLYAVGAVK